METGALAARDGLTALRRETTLDWRFVSPPVFLEPGEKRGGYRLGADQVLFSGEQPAGITVGDLADGVLNEAENRPTCASASPWVTEPDLGTTPGSASVTQRGISLPFASLYLGISAFCASLCWQRCSPLFAQLAQLAQLALTLRSSRHMPGQANMGPSAPVYCHYRRSIGSHPDGWRILFRFLYITKNNLLFPSYNSEQ